MAQADLLLERIAPGPYMALRKWLLSRQFSGVSRTDVRAVSRCKLLSHPTRVLGRAQTVAIGVTDTELLIWNHGRSIFGLHRRFDATEMDESEIEILEHRDKTREAAMTSSGNTASAVQRIEVRLLHSSGEEFHLRFGLGSASGAAVAKGIYALFPEAASAAKPDDDADGGDADGDNADDDALAELRNRYAAGEIDEEEFERRKRTLSE